MSERGEEEKNDQQMVLRCKMAVDSMHRDFDGVFDDRQPLFRIIIIFSSSSIYYPVLHVACEL